MFIVSEAWRQAFPGAAAGFLAMGGVANPPQHAALDRRKEELEAGLRSRYAAGGAAALKALPVLQAYNAHYKRFGKTYHVRLQLESVAVQGKPIPRVAALVEAMFMAELENLLLTAGHDLDAVRAPVRLDVSTGDERYVRLDGQAQALKSGDMFMADAEGVISSVIYGPDARTRLAPDTRRALFTVYAPAGIGESAVRRHLEAIRDNVRLIAPEAEVVALEVFSA